MPVETVQFLLKLLLKQNSCCAPWFPLIANCCKNVDSQTSFTLCQGIGVRNYVMLRVVVRYFASDSAILVFSAAKWFFVILSGKQCIC